MMCTLVMQ